jgi:hypothetical protein
VADPGPERIVIANWNARIASIMVLLLLSAASLGGIYDPPDRSARGQLWPGALFVAIPILFALRGLTVGLVIVRDKVISRGRFKTRTTPRADISAAGTVNYSGYWNRSSSSRQFLMLKLEVAGREIEIPAVAGRPVKVQRLANQMGDALGLVRRSAQTGQHRKPG